MATEMLTKDEPRAPQVRLSARSVQTGEHAAAISVSGLVKRFGATRALDGLDLTVRTGEVHGFLGPNGAGKTTTARILLGLLRRDGGEVEVRGEDPWRDVITLHRRLASMLATRRDVGSGILAQRPGQAAASPRLLSPCGLVWRLQRNALLGWIVAMAGFGLVFGSTMGLAAGAVRGDVPGELRGLIGPVLVQLPAILVIAGVVVALTGLLPRAAGALSWAVLLTAILLGPLFGAATLQLPAWAQDVSPFTHTPKLPAADLSAVPVSALLVIAAAPVVAGLASLRRRDLALPT